MPKLSENKFNFLFHGNSLTWGAYGLMQQDISLAIKDLLLPISPTSTIYSKGIGGKTIDELISNFNTYMLPKISSDPNTINVLIFNEDINGILNNGTTAEYNYQKVTEYIAQAKASGIDYVIYWNSPLPRFLNKLKPNVNPQYNNVLWYPNRLEQQRIFMDTINANPPIGCDVVVDMRQNAILGGYTPMLINKIYQHDSVHELNIGYNELAKSIWDLGIVPFFGI